MWHTSERGDYIFEKFQFS